MEINIGMPEEQRRQSAEALSRLLAGTYVLYIKTHNYHWNVTGTEFVMLHGLFEKQYNELFLAADEIAERIRALGFRAPATFAEFTGLSPIEEEAPGRVPAPEEMLRSLADGHETLCREIRDAVPAVQRAGDEGTNTLFGDRILYHEKTTWMLRAALPGTKASREPEMSKPELRKVASR